MSRRSRYGGLHRHVRGGADMGQSGQLRAPTPMVDPNRLPTEEALEQIAADYDAGSITAEEAVTRARAVDAAEGDWRLALTVKGDAEAIWAAAES